MNEKRTMKTHCNTTCLIVLARIPFLIGAVLFVLSWTTLAQPVRWPVNGHYYEAISGAPTGISWYEANAAAQARTLRPVKFDSAMTSQWAGLFESVLLAWPAALLPSESRRRNNLPPPASPPSGKA